MIQKSWLLALPLLVALLPQAAVAAEDSPGLREPENQRPTIRVETKSSSWRARRRVSFALDAAIRLRLAEAGLQTASSSESGPTLLVDYREERGQQVTLDIYGTEVTCRMTLMHPQRGELLSLTIQESPGYGSLSTLPYVDVIHRLETNPYFYFLGEVIQGALVGR